MTPPFVPLSGRVLIETIEPDRTTESGLVLVEDRKPETMGIVVAVAEPHCETMRELRRRFVEYHDLLVNEGFPCLPIDDLLKATECPPPPSVHVGDTVLFSWVSGQEIMLDDARYLIMPETDLLAVVE